MTSKRGKLRIDGEFIEVIFDETDGIVSDISEITSNDNTPAEYILIPPFINSHTHCADAGVIIPHTISLEDLVAPPNGLKHRYLRETPENQIKESISEYYQSSKRNGICTFMDFREGGVKGSKLLRETVPEAIILGRPENYDPNDVLEYANGFGIASITDVPKDHVDSMADIAHKKNGILGIHVSERIREDIDYVLSLEPDFLVHMTMATDSDMKKCADAGIPVSICATSNLFFGNVPPLKRMLDAGIEIMIGTDNAMLCKPDMMGEAKIILDLLNGQDSDNVSIWPMLCDNLRKILNHKDTILNSQVCNGYLNAFEISNEICESALINGNVPRILKRGI